MYVLMLLCRWVKAKSFQYHPNKGGNFKSVWEKCIKAIDTILIPKAGISNGSKYIMNNQINDTRNRNIKQRKPVVNSQISDILQVQCNNYM